ncbi:hypothetical protein FBF83_08510 [Pseudalkalibacillus hwajinpoensis]|uniref:Uncharacterized protein n=1 Tax=Guptibacillus hwajinpoensis TaxID=208199 RepID=A0A4U1MJG9_9BACL|nr:hypothetical protein FBF83_08510 [Pseudalkalibacillus hwajinpoensis]
MRSIVAFERIFRMRKLHLADWSGRMLDSCGMSGTGETPQARQSAPRRLSARPAESEHPGAEINPLPITTISTKRTFIKQYSLRKAYLF